MLPGKRHGVFHVVRTAIVCCEYEALALLGRTHVAEDRRQFGKKAHSSLNAPLRVVHVATGETEMICRGRHYLHQSAGSSPRPGIGVEARLLITLCRQQPPVPPRHGGIAAEKRVIFRDYAIFARQERSIDMTRNATRRQQKPLLLLYVGKHLGLIPAVKGFRQFAVALGHRPLHAIRIGTAELQSATLLHALRQHTHYKVGTTLPHPLGKLRRVFAHLHTKGDTKLLGELLTKQILGAEAPAVVFEICLRTA